MGKKKKRTKVSVKLLINIIAWGAGLFICGAGFFAVRWVIDNHTPAFEHDGAIRIYPDMTIDQALFQIDTVLHPFRPGSVRRTLLEEIGGRCLCEGSYYIKASSPARYLARAVTRGWQNPINVTISGTIRSKEELARKLSTQVMAGKESILAAFNDRDMLAKYGTSPETLFEMVIPDTYQMFWSTKPEGIISRLKKEYDAYWTQERVALAQKQGLTPAQVSVLASIISEETNRKDEYPKIASVYLNRLRKGMKLQACPTVCYIYEYQLRRVLMSHIMTQSPYNTYLNAGLPPTPIALPSKEHLEAVLHPDPTRYLYFCADSALNGHNVFSETYSEHQRNAALYHAALDARKKSTDSLSVIMALDGRSL